MSWIDVALLAVVVLVGLLGVLKGAKKSALSLGAFLIAFLLAFFLSTVIAEALLGIDGVKDFVLGNGVDAKAQWSLAKFIYSGWKVPDDKSFLFANFYKPMNDVIKNATTAIPSTGIDVAQAGFAIYGAFVLFSAICGVGIFIVVRLLLIIVTVIIKSYIGKKKTVMSRLVGFLIGAVRGAMWVFAFTLVFSCFAGYTFVPGIESIQNEYGDKAVMCNYVNDWAYGLRNKLFLPNKETYGRLVEMVYKKTSTDNSNAEKLAGDELKLFINVSNLGYDGAPWSIDNHKRKFTEPDNTTIKLRVSSEFESTGFDAVVQAILDYNNSIAAKIDGKKTGLTSQQFTTYDQIVAGAGMDNIDERMDDLWHAMRKYEYDYSQPLAEDEEATVRNSTLSQDYNAIKSLILNIQSKYEPFAEVFGAFPEIELPELKRVSTEQTQE
ncbi:MAG: hypothetical protein K2M47_07905 [Clostridiales bacterium]|nr:hypothetical protein [Clostridiales bacterium]